MDRFEGKVAVVTGGAQGMGKAIAARLVREGAQGVVIADIEEIPLKHTCEELGEKVTGIVCDVRSKASVDAMVWKTMRSMDVSTYSSATPAYAIIISSLMRRKKTGIPTSTPTSRACSLLTRQ